MSSELTKIIDGGAQALSSWLPARLRTLLDDGAHLMTLMDGQKSGDRADLRERDCRTLYYRAIDARHYAWIAGLSASEVNRAPAWGLMPITAPDVIAFHSPSGFF